jgi:hypothetical protein
MRTKIYPKKSTCLNQRGGIVELSVLSLKKLKSQGHFVYFKNLNLQYLAAFCKQ